MHSRSQRERAQSKIVQAARAARTIRDAAVCEQVAQSPEVNLTQIGARFDISGSVVSRILAKAGQPCTQWPKSKWLGKVVSNKEVIEVLDESDSKRHRYLMVRCTQCGLVTKVGSDSFSQRERNKSKVRCLGCSIQAYESACADPLVLTEAQARLATLKAAKGCFSKLGGSGAVVVDDVVQTALLKILLQGKSVTDHDDIGALSYRIAQFVAMNIAWNKKPEAISKVTGLDGDYQDIFDAMPVQIQPTEERERRALALATLSEADVEWMLRAQSRKKSASSQARFDRLAAQVRSNLEKFSSVVCQ